MSKRILIITTTLLALLTPAIASAHEAYVLPKDYFWNEIQKPFSLHALDALGKSENLHITIFIALSILTLLAINFFARESKFGNKAHQFIERCSSLGPFFVRVAIAAAFFYSAYSWSFLGPELFVQSMPFANVIRILLFASSFLIAIGLFTEIAAFISLIMFIIGFFVFGSYILTYLNYLGEIIVLLLFGLRSWSVDSFLFGKLKRFRGLEKYSTTIIRVMYGTALIYAGITVKLLHPDLTVRVVNDWNLAQFHWLFPSDSLLVTLGAGIIEVIIGLFIIFGFEMRLTVFISLIYITMSLLYFRELVWPHLMLYGISLNLILQPEVFTIDHLIFDAKRKGWWKRPFMPHNPKSSR